MPGLKVSPARPAFSFKEEHPHYLDLYQRYLRHRAIHRVLELGVASGSSLLCWRSWFNADVIGVDNRDEQGPCAKVPGIRIVIADQCAPELTELGSFDLIVDDAGHDPLKQARSLTLLWPQLNSGGLYVCEDLETSYWPLTSWNLDRLGDSPMEGWENPSGFVRLINGLSSGITAAYALKSPERFPQLPGLEAIHHHPNICFLEKT